MTELLPAALDRITDNAWGPCMFLVRNRRDRRCDAS